MAKRFALLVGIDLYLDNKARKVTINNLHGCVNDVKAVEAFLNSEYGLKNPVVLTSSIPEPVDYCCGQQALRRWDLNNWLRKLNKKGVYVVVILDSCYAAATWRGSVEGTLRTPHWPIVPNLPFDKFIEEDIDPTSSNRNAKAEVSWGTNPEGFTLMAACGDDEGAAETVIDGRSIGAFTHALLSCLEQGSPRGTLVNYLTLCDQVARLLKETQLKLQNPKVSGHDRLLFYSSSEPLPWIYRSRTEGDKIIVPAGKMHGVHPRSEFMLIHPIPKIIISIEEAHDFECSARISPEIEQMLKNRECTGIPSRWSLGESTLRVLIDGDFGERFEESLFESLQSRIASPIEVIRVGETDEWDSNLLLLEKGEDGTHIMGPESLIGYSGPLRGIQLKDNDIKRLTQDAAIALSHLTRFNQILNLQPRVSKKPPPFEVTLKNNTEKECSPDEPPYEMVIENKSDDVLYFTVMSFGPGFNIKQLWPSGHSMEVGRGAQKEFAFNIYISHELQGIQLSDGAATHRDILRTIVTTHSIAWTSLELPHVWEAHPMCPNLLVKSSRDAEFSEPKKKHEMWVHDIRILTSAEQPNRNI
ncbi:hypothetical protein V2G26_007466 [Clonostachys chloroleuca]